MTDTVLFDFAGLPRNGLEVIEGLVGHSITRNYREAETSNLRRSLMWDPSTMMSVISAKWGDDQLPGLLDLLWAAEPLLSVSVVLLEGPRLWLADSNCPARIMHHQAPWQGDYTGWLNHRAEKRLLVRRRNPAPTCVKPAPRYHLLLGIGRLLQSV